MTDTYAPAVNGVVRSVQQAKDGVRRLGGRAAVFAPGTRSLARARGERDVRYFPAIETNIYPHLHVSVLPLLPRHLRGFDVVHIQTPGPLGIAALVSARRLGIPMVYTYHTRFDDLLHYITRFESAERLLAGAAHRLDRALLRSASALVTPSRAIADELQARHGVRAEVVPTGVDTDVFRPAPRIGAGGPPTFLHLGRLSREKNLDAELRAFPLVLESEPRARLRVAGAGPDGDRARRIAKDLGIAPSVDFLGLVPEADLPGVYQAADVYVTASRFETQGLTVFEAMACGAAVALADVPVFDEPIARGAAVAFDPDSPEDVARAMLEAYRGRAELARAGLRLAHDASASACTDRLYALYARVAREAQRTTRVRVEG